ncbi:MAG: EAL domain-containing protein [Gallionellaceae bacterium]
MKFWIPQTRACKLICGSWQSSIKYRFAIGFGVATFLLMLTAGFVQYELQQETLNRRGVERAELLANTLAQSTSYLLLANDVVGLQEIMAGLSGTIDLKRVFILSNFGEVVASTQPKEIGMTVKDAISKKLLLSAPIPMVLVDQLNIIDVAQPVMAGKFQVGWVRVQLTRESQNADLNRLKIMWALFAVLGVVIVVVVTLWLSQSLTQGLRKLMRVTEDVTKGNREARASIVSKDEVGVLASDFNAMLDAMHEIDLRFRQLAENISQVFWITEPDKQTLLYISSAYEQIWGRTVQSLIQSPTSWVECIHHEDRQRILDAMPKQVQGTYDEEYRIVRPSGEVCWIHDRAFPIKDANGHVYRTVGIAEDVTLRKQADEAMRVSAVTFESHEAIMITDAHNRIIKVNKSFQEVTGYSADEVLGKSPNMLNSGRHDKEFYAEMWSALLDKGAWSGEIWDKRKNGAIYPKLITITAVKDRAGNVTQYVAIFKDISERKMAEEEIRNLAFYDSLTRLPNRRLLMDRLISALSISMRSRHYGALLFLDMDKFKTLNDTLGHDYGDMLLVEVAARIQSCVREVDTVSRLGGDEFVVLLEDVDIHAEEASQKVALIAEKIRAALAAPYQLKDNEYHSSPSIGVSLYRGNAESAETILKHADMAMYQVKDAGRNAVRFFDPKMQQAVETRALLEMDLRHAVSENQLHLYYQMQVDSEHRVIGAEALLRWIHPKRGMVSPAQFIPVAEESALIIELGDWVLAEACRQINVWAKDEKTKDLSLAVNVSARQFKQIDFVDKIAALMNLHEIEASHLKLELTESVVLNDVVDVVSKMHALKALGVKLSMDDFGTGYSSLSYLKQLPLDQIKIDQSFVRDMTSDQDDIVMVQTIIDLAKNFRLNVIAEGVETEGQLALLKHLGCQSFQGYLFSKPVPVEQFQALL